MDADPGNLAAKCDLAEALARAGEFDEAGGTYAAQAAAEHDAAPCEPGLMLDVLDDPAQRDVMRVADDEEVRFFLIRDGF